MSGPSFTERLTVGLAQLLEDEGLGTYLEAGAYGKGDVPITAGTLPPVLSGGPERAIAIAPYPLRAAVNDTTDVIGCQLRARGEAKDRFGPAALLDPAYDALHGRTNVHLSTGIWVLQIEWKASAPLGADASNRWERADSYELTVDRQTPHRIN